MVRWSAPTVDAGFLKGGGGYRGNIVSGLRLRGSGIWGFGDRYQRYHSQKLCVVKQLNLYYSHQTKTFFLEHTFQGKTIGLESMKTFFRKPTSCTPSQRPALVYAGSLV